MTRTRETAKGINLNGKAVNAGMFKAVHNEEPGTVLSAQPENMSPAMTAALHSLPAHHAYVQAVEGHYLLNQVAAKVRGLYPEATEFTIGIDASEVEDEYEDEPGYFLDRIITPAGQALFHHSFNDLEEDMLGISWQEPCTHEAAGTHSPFTGELRINIDQALSIPEYLKDPELKDAQPVPSKIDSEWGYQNARSTQEVELRRRAALNNPIFSNPHNTADGVEKLTSAINAQAESRNQEIAAAS